MDGAKGSSQKNSKDTFSDHDSSISLERTIYFIPEIAPANQKTFSAVKNVCTNFDDVLEFLEKGGVDKIIFHPLTNSHQKHYITYWAKLFNPLIKIQITTHFPVKPDGSDKVA